MESQPQHVPLHLRFLLIASLLVLLLAVGTEVVKHPTTSAPPPARPGPSDMHIVGGLRVDFITLGLPVKQVQERLGKGLMRPSKSATILLYKRYGLSVAIAHARVVSIYVLSPNFSTRNGIRVGTDVGTVIRRYGTDYKYEGTPRSYILHYWSQGIHFSVQNSRVTAILVTQVLPLR